MFAVGTSTYHPRIAIPLLYCPTGSACQYTCTETRSVKLTWGGQT
jgi:hypothetical protein